MITHKNSLYRMTFFSLVFLTLLFFKFALTANATVAFPSSDFNLTSMCKPADNEGSLRIRNDSGYSQYYTLSLYGNPPAYTGTVPVGDTLITVPWNSGSDTWILNIGGNSYTKAIGNNELCETPDVPEFGLITGGMALITSGGLLTILRKRS